MWTAQIQFTDKQVEQIYDAAKDAGVPMDEFVRTVLAEAAAKLACKT